MRENEHDALISTECQRHIARMIQTSMKKHRNEKIAIVGLGYVGLPLAVEFGRFYEVVGFDVNPVRVEELKAGQDSTMEVELANFLGARHLSFSTDVADIKDANVYIITVPTPVDSANRPDMSHLIAASRTVGSVLNQGNLVIYESTVYPGATEEVCVPILEAVSGLQFNQDFVCGYSPERVNPGDKVNTLTAIRKITSGSSPDALEWVDTLYAQIIDAGTWRARNIRVAEAAKVIENSQRDLNIAFVNELSMIFDRMGIDTLEVLEAAGSKWNFLPFRPGMVGGHCIGVDPYYLTHKAEMLGYSPQVILAGRRINDSMASYAAQSVTKRMSRSGVNIAESTIGVMGITFKENCPDIRNSKIFDLISELNSWGVSTVVSDPWANPVEVFDGHGIVLSVLTEENPVDGLIVAVGHQQFRELKAEDLIKLCRSVTRPVIGDLKSLFDKAELVAAGFEVFRL